MRECLSNRQLDQNNNLQRKIKETNEKNIATKHQEL